MRHLWITFLILVSVSVYAKPKYGPKITLLRDSPHYLRKAESTDFWALIPYYSGQQTDASCSLAVTTMLINALGHPSRMKTEQKMVTADAVLANFKDGVWAKATMSGGNGVTLGELASNLRKVLADFSIKNYQVTAQHLDPKANNSFEGFRAILEKNEADKSDFLLINFIQGALTGDGDIGHFSIVGAYDATQRQVLILDVDRDWYEPYWVTDHELWKAATTFDKESDQYRGYIHLAPVT